LNQITNYAYDNLNLLTNITYPDATENIALTYDAISQLTKATKNAQDITFAYDKRRQVTSTTDVYGKLVAYTLDAAQNRTALKLDGTNFVTYAYDVADRLTKITSKKAATVTFWTPLMTLRIV
jgi:YD repeat-containing protein